QLLQSHLAEAHWRWKVWRQMFCDSGEEGYRLMNSQAPAFFGLLENVLLDDIVLWLCKLADPKEQRGRENLSLEWAITDAEPRLGDQAAKARRLLDELRRLMQPFRTWRHRRIAHHDKKTALRAEVLDPVRFADIDRAIGVATEIMKRLDGGAGEFAYDGM